MELFEIIALYDEFECKPLGDSFLDSLFDADATAVYYRFLHRLCEVFQPQCIVELGVCTGRSTAHLAAASPRGRVYGIDIAIIDLPEIQARYSNIEIIQGSSDDKFIVDQFCDRSIDLCFFDTVHDGPFLKREMALWCPKVKIGGLLLFDDIHMFPSMSEAWSEIPFPKVELPKLHYTGFGAAIVST